MVWHADGTLTDLSRTVALPAPWRAVRVIGLNDDGVVIVRAGQPPAFTAGGPHFLLTPVPEGERVAQCGGGGPCQCGDTVVADYTFTAHLGPCAVQGTDAALVVAPGVHVNGNGYWLWGTGDGTGVLFDGAQGSQVGWLHVTGFNVGVKMRAGASGNYYHGSWVFGNHQGVLVDGAHRNWIWVVYAMHNQVSGFSVVGGEGNVIGHSIAWSNPTSLVMAQANGNTIWVSGFHGDRGHAMTMVDSHGNGLYWNHFIHGDIQLVGSPDNTWHQNAIECPVVSDQAVTMR